MGTLAFLCTNLWFLLILDPCLSRRWPCDRPLESNVKMFWRWETIGKTHWENHWEKLKLNVIFWDLFFFWGGAVFEQCIQRGCGGPELETSHDRPGSKPVPGAPQTLSDAIEEENFEFDVPWDSQNRWTYKGKNIGCEEKCGKFFGLKLEVGRFLDFQNFYFGCFKIVFQFFIALIRSQSGHVFCCYHFRSSGATPEVVFFFESRWSERAFGWMFTSWCQDMSPTTWWHVWKQLKISWKGKEENQGVDFPEKLTFCFWLAWKSAPKRFVFLTFEDVVFENGVKLRSQWLMIWNPQYTSREAEKMLFLTTWKLFNFGKTHQHECI